MESKDNSGEKRKWGALPTNPYIALGISSNATKDEIRTAWKLMVRKYHPDLNPENKQEATEWTQIVNEAKSLLLDPNFKGTHFSSFTNYTSNTNRQGGGSTEDFFRKQRENTERARRAEEERRWQESQERARRMNEERIRREQERLEREAAERVRKDAENYARQQQEEAERQRQEEERKRNAPPPPPIVPPTPIKRPGFLTRNAGKLALLAGLGAVGTGTYLGERSGWFGKDEVKNSASKETGKNNKRGEASPAVMRIAKRIGLENVFESLSEVLADKNIGLEKLVNAIIVNEGSSKKGVENNPGNIIFIGAPGQLHSGAFFTGSDGKKYEFASYSKREDGIDAIRTIITTASDNGANFAYFIGRYTGTGTGKETYILFPAKTLTNLTPPKKTETAAPKPTGESFQERAREQAKHISEGFTESTDGKGQKMFIKTQRLQDGSEMTTRVFSDGHIETTIGGKKLFPEKRMLLSPDEADTFGIKLKDNRTEKEIKEDLEKKY